MAKGNGKNKGKGGLRLKEHWKDYSVPRGHELVVATKCGSLFTARDQSQFNAIANQKVRSRKIIEVYTRPVEAAV